MLATTAPILPARDFDETSEFYTKIGFEETGRWPDQYMIMYRDQVELHFFPSPNVDPLTTDHMAYIRSEAVDELTGEIVKLGLPVEGVPRYHPAEDKSWGMREMAIIDPNGTLLRIGQFI